ncbi:MAG: hypothetical protein Q9210_005661, partial [Variospora velana]
MNENVMSPLLNEVGKPARVGGKRREDDEALETTTGKRVKTSEIPQSHTTSKPEVMRQRARWSPFASRKTKAVRGKSLRLPDVKSQQPEKPPNSPLRSSQAVDSVRWEDRLPSPSTRADSIFSAASCISQDRSNTTAGYYSSSDFDYSSNPEPGSTTAGYDVIQSDDAVPLAAENVRTRPNTQTEDPIAAYDSQQSDGQYPDFDFETNNYSILEKIANDKGLQKALALADEHINLQAPTAEPDFLQPPITPFALTDMPFPMRE